MLVGPILGSPMLVPPSSVGRPSKIRTPEFTWFKTYGLSSLACVQWPTVLQLVKRPLSEPITDL